MPLGTRFATSCYHLLSLANAPQVRIWDTHNILQKTVIKPALARPVRTAVNAVSYNSTGSFIAAGLADGTVQVWGVGGECGQGVGALVSEGPGAIPAEPGGSRCEAQYEEEVSTEALHLCS